MRSVPVKSMRSAVIVAVGSSFRSARPIVDLPEPALADDAEPLAAEGEARRPRTACIADAPRP